jgi:uracil-DNA glycosylase
MALLLGIVSLLPAAKTHAELPFQSFDSSWKRAIGAEFQKPYFKELEEFLSRERKRKTIFPVERETFTAFDLVSFDDVRVVIIGQDPYPGTEVSSAGKEIPLGHGLAFSVRPEIRQIPGSLRNIFKKLNQELGIPIPKQGNLEKWARQGILLINSTLTLEKGKANSHFNKPSREANWGTFTDAVIDAIAAKKRGVVFVLWGAFAHTKEKLITRYPGNDHLVLKTAHPSPLSAKLFLNGPDVFRPINKKLGRDPINWSLK